MKSFFNCFKRRPALTVTLLFFLCVFISFSVRTYHYNNSVYELGKIIRDVPDEKQPSFFKRFIPYYHKNFAPFTIESGMMFSYAQDIAEGKGVPKNDKLLLGQEDIAPYEQMIMGLEWFLGWGYRIKNAVFPDPSPTPEEQRFEDNPRMSQWMSMQIRLWASLTTGFIFLWLIVLRCPPWLAFLGGLLHAVSLAAVARATGQDLVRGEFAMPFLIATLVLAHSIYLKPGRLKYLFLLFSSFAALATWDLCLGFFSVWAVFEIFRYGVGGIVTPARRNAWIIILIAVGLNALFIPFNRAYSLIMSPLLLVFLPSLLFLQFFGRERKGLTRIVFALLIPLALYGFWMLCVNTPEYASNYSHFNEMMKAKLQFGNVKPADPDLLTYDARIMWTPSMHSATWVELISFFPSFYMVNLNLKPMRFLFGMLPLTLTFFYLLLLAATLFSLPRKALMRGVPRTLMPVLFTIGFTIGFYYIVRYHEFLIIFLAVALPLVIQDYLHALRCRPAEEGDEAYKKMRSHPKLMFALRGILLFVFAICLFQETRASLFLAKRRYTGDVPHAETARLIEWFRRYEHTKGKGVMANLTLGPMMKAYCGSAIALNPQFGLERIRRPTEIFIRTLFTGNEQQLAEFCNELNAQYFIYNKGALAPMTLYSNRYIAAAKEISGEAPANMMYFHPDKLQWFYRIDPPHDLRTVSRAFYVYRLIRPEEKINSMKAWAIGNAAFEDGDMPLAKRCARTAVLLDPTSEEARNFFLRIFRYYPKITLDGME